MDKTNFRCSLFIAVIELLVVMQAHARAPVWAYSAPSPATTTITVGNTATVQYTVTNQSNKSKDLILRSTPGLSASSCYLDTKGSTCTLTLTVNGSAVPGDGIHTGPLLCERSNPNQCYRPSQGNELNVTLSSITTYQVTASGDSHVSPTPTTQNIISGATGTINLTIAPGYTAGIASDTCGGSISGTTFTTGAVTAPCSVSFSSTAITNYTGIYAETNNSLVTYSPNNGVSWGYMLSPQGGWYWDFQTWATAVTSNGTMYQATGVQGNGLLGNGAATLIYSSDGISWTQVASFPTSNDIVISLFALGNTVYVGTLNGYVYSTSDQGVNWQPGTAAKVPDNSVVSAIVVDGSGNYYAGTVNGNVYYSTSAGESWTALTNQPVGGANILSLAIDTTGILYAVTGNNSQPQYNNAPLTTGTWQTMTAMPGAYGSATTIAASGSVVYVGTSNSFIAYTSDLGGTWNGNQLPNDNSGITSLFVNQSTSLSKLFVESYGTIQLTGSSSMGSITVTNFSSTVTNNVRANSNQLPAGITSSSCASVASGGSCSITLTAAGGAKAFAPTAFDIIDRNNSIISRSALVSSVTPDGGSDYYYVYNVNGTTSYVLDNNNGSNGVIWSSNGLGAYDGGIALYGISEISTTSSPNPNNGQVMGQTACNGATVGSCDANNIQVYYSAIPSTYYAEGICYHSTNGAASSGDWYLPASCELNGGIYFNLPTNSFSSCSPVLTGISSLHNLGALGGNLQGLLNNNVFWSSTEDSFAPQSFVWYQQLNSGGGSYQYLNPKFGALSARCVRNLAN